MRLLRPADVMAGEPLGVTAIFLAATRDDVYALRRAIVECFEALDTGVFQARSGETLEYMDGVLQDLRRIWQTTKSDAELDRQDAHHDGRHREGTIEQQLDPKERVTLRLVRQPQGENDSAIAGDEILMASSSQEVRALHWAVGEMVNALDDDSEFDLRAGYPREYIVQLLERLAAVVHEIDGPGRSDDGSA